MRVLLIAACTYLFLIFVMNVGPKSPDLLLVLLFLVAYNEPLTFALVYGFLLGLLIDLVNPANLGIHALVYTLLPLVIQFLKVRLYQNVVSVSLSFLVIFILKVVVIGLAARNPQVFSVLYFFYTIVCFFPIFLITNRLLFRAWMKKA